MGSTSYTLNLGLPQFSDSDIPTWGDINTAFAKLDLVVGAIAPKFDDTQAYAEGDYVQHDGEIYRCKADIVVPKPWDRTDWDRVVLTDLLESTTHLTGFIKVDDVSGTGISTEQYAHLTVTE